MDPSLQVTGLGVAGAASWGTGDFAGGLATRRAKAASVLAASQAIGLVALVALALATGERMPSAASLAFGAAAGLAGAAGILALYGGLAIGPMSVVAPLSGVLAAAVPLPLAFARHGAATPGQVAGMLAGLAGIWLVAGATPGQAVRPTRRALALALGSGAAFGVFYLLLHAASETATFWPLAAARAASIAVAGVFVIAQRMPLPVGRAAWGLTAAAGLLDAAGNLFFALASHAGRLDVASLLVSLYPAATVLLALAVLRERLSLRQGLGIVAMVGCIVLVTVSA